MSKAVRVREWIKTALIITLSISTVLLGWRTNLFDDIFYTIPFFGRFTNFVGGSPPEETTGVIGVEAARPISIVITFDDGERFGVRYETDVRNTVYDWTSSILGEALASAFAYEEISAEEWRTALSGMGVFFEYASPVNLSVLHAWLGAGIDGLEYDIPLRRIFVAFGEFRNRVYFKDDSSGVYFTADTNSSAAKAQELEMLRPNATKFAFELGVVGAENAPYTIIKTGTMHPNIAALPAASAESILEVVRDVFGHGREVDRTYFDGDTLVSVGAHFNIRIEPDGRVIYRRTDGLQPTDTPFSPSESEMIEMARAVVSDTIGRTSGGAELFFETLEFTSEDSGIVTFEYYIAGGRIRLGDDVSAARVYFTNSIISEATLFFRNFSIISDEYTELLPELLTFAAAGGDFTLSFPYIGSDTLIPTWIFNGQ
jgi:hypothetical protein